MFTQYKYSRTELLLFPVRSYSRVRLGDRLRGKTVLITGASFGIGESLAMELAALGAHLILVARTIEKLEEIKGRVMALGGSATVFQADLARPEQVAELIVFLQSLPNGIDIVVSNAGKSIRRPIAESLDRLHDFERTMAVNYHGPVQLLLSLIPMLKQRKGHVINVSSVSVLLAPAPYWAAYQASKSAFDQWFRCTAPELHAWGIDTTTIYLPLVGTRMIAPTQHYNNMPAMRSEHVAAIICRYLVTRKRQFMPWWLVFGQLGSVLFRRLWERANISLLKRKAS